MHTSGGVDIDLATPDAGSEPWESRAEDLSVIVVAIAVVLMAATGIKPKRIPRSVGVEVPPVDQSSIPRPSDLRGVRGGRRIVRGAVQAPRPKGVPVEVRLAATAADMLVTRVDLAAVVGKFCPVVERGEPVLIE